MPEERARETEAAASQRLRRDPSNEGPDLVRHGDAKSASMVIGAVDAQNSSGAKIRSRCFCALSPEGNNRVRNEIVFEQR